MNHTPHELRTARGIIIWSAAGLVAWAVLILVVSL
jgi:hypothetical protein